MKKVSISAFAILAIVFAVTSAFTTRNDGKAKKFVDTYSLYSVNQDQVGNADGLDLSKYGANLRVDITTSSYMNNDIGAAESISTWIASNPSGTNTVPFYCNQSDADQVCLAKIKKVNGVNNAVLEFISGDVDQSTF
jgi:hypothetical protein